MTESPPRWNWSPDERARILALLEADLADGALGIGILAGYAPSASPDGYLSVAALAARSGAPAFTHSRDLAEFRPSTVVDGAGMTGIGAAFLAPQRLDERGLVPSDLTYAPAGERVASLARLRESRAADPGGLAIIRHLDEPSVEDRELLMRYLLFPGAVVASDAMPLTWPGPEAGDAAGTVVPADEGTWPLPPTAFTHPRTAGTFSRAIRLLTRDSGALPLPEALAKCGLEPARLLEDHVPAMRRKGRITPGADADIVVFDPATISDQATYADSTRPSSGIRHVLVNGEFVVRDGHLVTTARPGRPVRAG